MRSEWPGDARRNPCCSQPDYLTQKALSVALYRFAANVPQDRPVKILDIGCGAKPYLPFFSKPNVAYLGVDSDPNSKADRIIDLDQTLPFSDNEFDFVLSTQVLEHVKSPESLLHEIHRVLKVSGSALISAPFVWEIHNYPVDYWRFSQQGLAKLCHFFSDIAVIPCGNTIQGMLQTFLLLLDRRMKNQWFKGFLFGFSNRFLMGFLARFKDDLLPVNYIIEVQK